MAKEKRKQKLKVFRTPVGFHDAYVAAPSQKAALEAWGSDANLFASGAAEQVTDAKLMAAPLERPGEVIKVLRGTEAEQVAALGQAAKARKKEAGSRIKSGATKKESKPNRAALDSAEQRIASLDREQAKALRKIDSEIERLERRRRDLLREQEAERDEAAAARDRAREAYDRAMRRWRSG